MTEEVVGSERERTPLAFPSSFAVRKAGVWKKMESAEGATQYACTPER